MSNPYLLAVALSISALTAACSPHEKANAERVFQALGASPVDLAETSSGEDEPIAPEPTYPVIAAAPVHVPQWGDADYQCVPVFGSLSCDDQGKPHHIDGGFNWID